MRLPAVANQMRGLPHGESDRARGRRRARSAGHGYGAGPCRGAGITAAATAIHRGIIEASG